MKYEVTVFKVVKETYHVEADSIEDAIYFATDGKLVKSEKTHELACDIGMSFDEAFEQGIDLDYIRSRVNSDRNFEHIEGLESIKLI